MSATKHLRLHPFMTKNKKRIIWVLTSDANMEDLEKIDPYSSKAKQYVKFKKD